MSKESNVRKLMLAADGFWSGEETMVIDPETGATMTAHGQFESKPVFGETGFRSDYKQTVEGQTSIEVCSIFRFTEAGEASLTWIPRSGDPATYAGSFKGAVMDLKSDAGGKRQVLRSDYSETGRLVQTMTWAEPGGDPVEVFKGVYTRTATVPGRQMWRDLTVPDAETSKDFYAEVLGWTPKAEDMGGYNDYHMLDAAGEIAAGVCHARGGNAELPPRWLIYFAVADVDAAVAAAQARGGRLTVGPKSYEHFKYAVLTDPDDAPFVVCEMSKAP